MRVIVCGSRDFENYSLLNEELNNWLGELDKKKLVILSGAAKGADTLGEKWAYANYVTVERYHADWEKHGKAAGPIRNSEMLEAGAQACIAFWDGISRGTKDMIDKARAKGIKVKVVLC